MRLLGEIHIHLTTSEILTDGGQRDEAASQLTEAEATMRRAIACGAMVDPWNILGFQGFYPLFTAREDSVPDRRIAELVQVVERLFALYARMRSEAAAVDDGPLGMKLATRMGQLATWWDRFATTTVSDVRHVAGQEAVTSAANTAGALAAWHEHGATVADLAFWRRHLKDFRTPKAFALVLEELLRKDDYRAAMGLLMNWLSQADDVPLQDGTHSFHALAMRWMLGVSLPSETNSIQEPLREQLVCRFIDHLEANADAYWQVPRLERPSDVEERAVAGPQEQDDDDALFGAAYEGVTYRDSTDDGNEGELLGFEPRLEFDLESQARSLGERLQFLSTVSRLLHIGMHTLTGEPGRKPNADQREVLLGWLTRARRNYHDLLALMDSIHEKPIPAPSGAYDSLVEFDRRGAIKQQLLMTVIGTALEWAMTVALSSAWSPTTRMTKKIPLHSRRIPSGRDGSNHFCSLSNRCGAAMLRGRGKCCRGSSNIFNTSLCLSRRYHKVAILVWFYGLASP